MNRTEPDPACGRMRIAIVAANFPPQPGGMERHALGLAESLAALGHAVSVATTRQHAGHAYDLPVEVRPVLGGRPARDLPRLGLDRADVVLTTNAGHAPLARMTGRPVVCYCHGNDVLAPWVAFSDRLAVRLAARAARLPGLAGPAGALRRSLVQGEIGRGLAAARGVIVNSSFTRGLLRARYPALGEGVEVIPPGLPDAFLAPLPERAARAAGAPVRILTVARLSADARLKRVDALLEGLSRVAGELPFEHVVIGGGDRLAELEALAARLGTGGRTRFLGVLPNAAVRDWLDRSDLFALTTFEPGGGRARGETFGMVHAEAAARGVPSLAVRAGGVVDILRDGENAVLIEDAAPETIAAGLRRAAALAGGVDRARIAAEARRFAWSEIGPRIERALAAALARRAPEAAGARPGGRDTASGSSV